MDTKKTIPGHISFAEWRQLNPEIAEEITCQTCKGTGKIACPHCGQDMECDDCDGAGKINDPYDAYCQACYADEKRLKAWKQ